MTEDGWRYAIVRAAREAENGQPKLIDFLSKLLAEQDAAKASLIAKGYGCTGMPWPELVDDVDDRT